MMVQSVWRTIRRSLVWRDQDGQGLVEYGLILVLIAVFCMAAMRSFQSATTNTIQNVADSLATVS